MSNQIPDCLKELIGLRARCQAGKPAPKTNLYFDDVPGFSLPVLSEIADRDTDETGVALFERSVDLATRLMCREVFEKLDADAMLSVKDDLHATQIGWLRNDKQPLYFGTESLMRGVRIKKRTLNAKMQALFVREVGILSNTNINATITIKDGTYSVSKSVDLVAGAISTVMFDYQALGNELFILMPNNLIETARTTVAEEGYYCTPCCGICGYTNDPYLELNGWNGTGDSSYTYGIIADIGITCDSSRLFCSMTTKFGLALLYRTAMLVAEHALFSGRVNSTVDSDRWTAIFNNSEANYNRHLSNLMIQCDEVVRKFDSTCIECRNAKQIFAKF